MGDKRDQKWKPKQRAAIAYKEFAESKKKRKRDPNNARLRQIKDLPNLGSGILVGMDCN